MKDANLKGANLRGANLKGVDLKEAYLVEANLKGVDLKETYLTGANLCGANLREASLSGAILQGVNLSEAKLPPFQIPQEGSLIVWKKLQNGLCKLKIPKSARRTASLVGRKCRAERARVLWLENGEQDVSVHESKFVYRVGEFVEVKDYDDDVRVECARGIHFFLTREEAENYNV